MKKLLFGFMLCFIGFFPGFVFADSEEDLLTDLNQWTYHYKPAEDPNEHFAFYELENYDFTHFEARSKQAEEDAGFYHPSESVYLIYTEEVVMDDLDIEELESLKMTLFKIQQNIEDAIVYYDSELGRLCGKYFSTQQSGNKEATPDKDDCKRSISEFTKANSDEQDYRDYERAYRSVQYAREKLLPQLEIFNERLDKLLGISDTYKTSEDPLNLPQNQGVNAPTYFDDEAGEYADVKTVRFRNVEQELFPSWRGSGQVQLKMEQMIQRMSPAERARLTELEEQLKLRQKEYEEAKLELEKRQDEVRTKNADIQEANRSIDRLEEQYSNCQTSDSRCTDIEREATDAISQKKAAEEDTRLSKAKLQDALTVYENADNNLKDAQAKYDAFLTKWHALNILPQGVIGTNCDGNFLLDYLPVFVRIILMVVAPLVFIMMVYAGVKFIYGGDDEEVLSSAKKWFAYGAIGVILIILSYSLMKATYFVFSTTEEEYEYAKYQCEQAKEVIETIELDETDPPPPPPPEPECGNGVVEEGEECDDGNTEDGDGCSSTCIEEETCPVPEPVSPPPRDYDVEYNSKEGIPYFSTGPVEAEVTAFIRSINDIFEKIKEKDEEIQEACNRYNTSRNESDSDKMDSLMRERQVFSKRYDQKVKEYCQKTKNEWIPRENAYREQARREGMLTRDRTQIEDLDWRDYQGKPGYEWLDRC